MGFRERLNKQFDSPWKIATFPLLSGGFKQAVAVILAHMCLQPLLGSRLPEADEYLESQGYDSAIAEGLAGDREVRIRDRMTFAGYFHDVTDIPMLAHWLKVSFVDMSQDFTAYARTESSRLKLQERLGLDGACYVTPQVKRDVVHLIETLDLANIPAESIEYMPITPEQEHAMVLLHELRHCHPEQREAKVGLLGEADSDVHALERTANYFDNPEIIDVWLYNRVLKHGYSRSLGGANAHDGSLYIDSYFNGQALPTAEQMESAGDEAYDTAETYLLDGPSKTYFIRMTDAFRQAIHCDGATMSPLARRSAELYVEATEFFTPSSVHVDENAGLKLACSAQPQLQ